MPLFFRKQYYPEPTGFTPGSDRVNGRRATFKRSFETSFTRRARVRACSLATGVRRRPTSGMPRACVDDLPIPIDSSPPTNQLVKISNFSNRTKRSLSKTSRLPFAELIANLDKVPQDLDFNCLAHSEKNGMVRGSLPRWADFDCAQPAGEALPKPQRFHLEGVPGRMTTTYLVFIEVSSPRHVGSV